MTMPTSESNAPPAVTDQIIACETGGGYQIGFADDAPGPFESRAFAEAVAARWTTINAGAEMTAKPPTPRNCKASPRGIVARGASP
jgi:hypothetical protein